jgi:hypothetical protein
MYKYEGLDFNTGGGRKGVQIEVRTIELSIKV